MREKRNYLIHDMVEIAMLVAIAIVLDAVGPKFRISPEGGSISFSMFTLFIIALRHGPVKGLVGGLLYALITWIIDGYNPASLPFDYIIGYAGVFAIGFYAKHFYMHAKDKQVQPKTVAIDLAFISLGILIAVVIRLFGSTLSSMIVYEYKLAPALAYNVTYIPLSGVLCLAILIVVYEPLRQLTRRFKSGYFHSIDAKQENKDIKD